MRKTEVQNAKILFKFSYSVSSQVFNEDFLVNVAKLSVLLINHNFTFLVKVLTTHKKLPICKNKLPQKICATRYGKF